MTDSPFRIKNTLVVNTTFTANSSSLNMGTINSSSVGVLVTNSSITVGNSSVNASINSTIYSGTANNTLYLGGIPANTYVTTNSTSTFSSSINMGTINSSSVGLLITNSSITVGNSSVNASINSTIYSGTSNNALYLNGVPANTYVTTNSTSTFSNVVTFNSNVVYANSISLIANATPGTNGQVLVSNGTSIHWNDPISGLLDTKRAITASTSTTNIDFTTAGDKAKFFKLSIQSSTTLTFINFPSVPNGEVFPWTVMTVNDNTAGRAVAFGNTIKWAGNVTPTRTTAANAVDLWTFFVESNTIYGSLAIADARSA